MDKKLYKSEKNKIGYGLLAGFLGFLSYIIADSIIPKKGKFKKSTNVFEEYSSKFSSGNHNK